MSTSGGRPVGGDAEREIVRRIAGDAAAVLAAHDDLQRSMHEARGMMSLGVLGGRLGLPASTVRAGRPLTSLDTLRTIVRAVGGGWGAD
ncbi:MAG: hypothetical protein OXI79_14820 [Gammaproteobacteria bacterium]|nr:hypothetical protein [Gammaproteobacteria bacterium]